MRIYKKDDVCGFRYTRETWGAFSNFQPLAVPIVAGPWALPSSEHLYQAAKFGAAPDVQHRIANAPTAREAAAIGRSPLAGIDPRWTDQRVNVMRWVLRMKREANADAIDAALDAHRRAPDRGGFRPRPLVGRPAGGRQLPRLECTGPALDGTPPTAAGERPGGAVRRVDRPDQRRPPGRPAVPLTGAHFPTFPAGASQLAPDAIRGAGLFICCPSGSETRPDYAPAPCAASFALRRRREAEAGRYRAFPHGLKEVPHATRSVSRRRHRRRARLASRSRLPPLPAPWQEAGALLGRGRPRRRPRALALRPPLAAPACARQVDR